MKNSPISDTLQKSIIVVDDDAAVRDSLSVLLGLAGWRVDTCASGVDLLVMMQTQTADCLIIDVHMPDMTGLELVAELNASHVTIPVVLISGNMGDTIETNARQLGVTQLLRKPFTGTSLIETVTRILG